MRTANHSAPPAYFMLLTWEEGQVALIRDYRYARYVMRDAEVAEGEPDVNWMMVRYKVKADRAAENEGYISRVFEQLKRENPPGLHYAVFKLDDGVSFIHMAARDDTDGSNPLTALSAFQAFTAKIGERCEEPPAGVELQPVAAYAWGE